MFAVFKREVQSYFYSPIAYVLTGLFVLVVSIFFFLSNIGSQSADFNPTLSTISFILIFIVPILTMRIIAEDRKNGTEVLLITSPSTLSGIVVGKYLAMLFVFLVMTCLTFVYPIILFIFGNPPLAPLIGSYVGLILFAAALISIGVFASSLTENQVISVFISFVIMLIIWIIEPIGNAVGGWAAVVLNWFSLSSRYNDFTTGILNVGSIIYFISFIAVFLFLTIRVIEKRRWSQG
ncbi:ABC-2 type transport system permease protein [Anaerobacterium chartisolvens]|uniref:ABC-2 type transport system permease protein n=1 Tax=Anaerobacterium chartisolvens TaxID=1297424 RepID=A0A369BI48_9FIRM|nr:ABC-2 transporter permease [Anaerobacterium chartisolvens]RCX20935.1 ABC-2 type transport system permease protein [Anaerobacterium chartisolvens]